MLATTRWTCAWRAGAWGLLAAMAAGAHAQLDLGDIAVGGDGSGATPVGTGLRITNGQLVSPLVWGGSSYQSSSFFLATDGSNGTADLPYVDGVFFPKHTTTISTSGLSYAFGGNGGYRWDALRNAAALYETYPPPVLYPIRLGDQPGVDRLGLGMHANAGVTFDLSAIRNSGAVFDAVAGVGGINFSALVPGWYADFTLWIVVDGTLRYQQSFVHDGLTYEAFNVPLSATDHFLTIATTDADFNNQADHAVLADLRLVPEPTAGLLCLLVVVARRRLAD